MKGDYVFWKLTFANVKSKMVKVTLVQALRLCTSRTAHRGSRGIALLFHVTNGTRRGWGVSVTPRPLFTPRKDPVPIVQEAGWALGPVWIGTENFTLHRGSIPGPSSPYLSRYTVLSYTGPFPNARWINTDGMMERPKRSDPKLAQYDFSLSTYYLLCPGSVPVITVIVSLTFKNRASYI